MKYIRPTLISVAAVSFCLAAALTWFSQPKEEITIKITPYDNDAVNHESARNLPIETHVIRVHNFVKNGDTLGTILAAWNQPYQVTQKVLEADLTSLKLDTIKPGDRLELILDGNSKQLVKLIYHESLVERAIYTKNEDGTFTYQFVEEPGQWKERLYSGDVNGSFSLSANRLGLNATQIANITRVLKDKINFSRDFRAGDSFNVLVKQQYLDGYFTGNTEMQGISIHLRGREVAAFLAEDGRFYDRKGNSLEQAFNRYPVANVYRRVTSSFNPYRKHPVTGRVSPHNGTDFGTPTGTPIYSTGEGRVIMVRNHPYAGNYVVIEHNSIYKTRYLHLSKILVKKGQYVKRGQKIGLSGATGRVTGPHLHFEVLVRNRAVNAMKVNIPLASSISKKDKPKFLAKISSFDNLVAQQQAARESSSNTPDV